MLRNTLVFAILFAASCVPLAPSSSPVRTPAFSSPITTPSGPASPILTPSPAIENATAVQQAVQDLAARLNVEAGEITVEEINLVEIALPDTSCAPDQYSGPSIPAQVMGQEIKLAVHNQTYTYHARGRKVTLCTAQEP